MISCLLENEKVSYQLALLRSRNWWNISRPNAFTTHCIKQAHEIEKWNDEKWYDLGKVKN